MPSNQTRAILPLLKARIIDRGPNHFTLGFGSEYGSPTTIRVAVKMENYDIRDGDLLTIYTEVLLKQQETNNASPIPPPIK